MFPVPPATLEENLQDLLIRTHPASIPSLLPHIWIDIDNPTIQHLGEPPRWNRNLWIQLFRRLEGAHPRNVWLDVLFIHPHPEDPEVARAFGALHLPLCLPATGVLTPPAHWTRAHALHVLGFPLKAPASLQYTPSSTLPLYNPWKKGFVEVLLDPDGALRHPLPLRLAPSGGQKPFAICDSFPANTPIPDFLPYLNADDMLRVSLLDVLEGRVPEETFFKKYVWIGASAEGLNDRIVLHGKPVPGILAHVALHLAREGRGWNSAPNALLFLHILLLLFLVGYRKRLVPVYLLTSLIFQAITFHFYHWIWPQAWPLGLVGVMLGTDALRRGIQHWKERHHLMEMFQIYVSGNVLRDLLHHPSPDALQPRIRQLAVMFVDLRGFTAFTERSRPSDVEQFLNQYYTLVAETVHRHQGTVSKFIGDGVLVVFGDPNPLPDQCCVAFRCALDLLQTLLPFVTVHGLDVGIALHQGEGLVGHFGSKRRREYSVFGDVVNTASRMETLNKHFRTRLLFSKPFAHCAREVVDLGPYPIRGKETPLELFTLPGPPFSIVGNTGPAKR